VGWGGCPIRREEKVKDFPKGGRRKNIYAGTIQGGAFFRWNEGRGKSEEAMTFL